MSFTDRLWLWLHLGFVLFTIGPVTIATMSTPRYIRARNIGVLRYLARMTRVFGAASLGVALFGIIEGQSKHEMAKAWITASLTLFVVALVLLVLIMRDQARAIAALETAAPAAPGGPAPAPAAAGPGAASTGPAAAAAGGTPTAADVEPPPAAAAAGTAATAAAQPGAAHVATVERGRIASMAGVVSLIWLVILVLMVWNS
jgi:hypothetical protein